MELRLRVFQLLQESAVPVTDKIFPWFVQTALVRVEMEGLQDALRGVQDVSRSMPKEMAAQMDLVMKDPIRSIDDARCEVADLTDRLRKSAVLEAAISRSGWRGLVAAMAAIFRQQNLGIMVGLIALGSGLFGGWLVWQVGARSREVLDRNDGVIERCYERFLPAKGTRKWFSCPGFQLPRSR